ncbi:MAG: HU family DNA-binding protein [Planctomycetota bacterium]|jgi:DNA-binding protein HU-beta|nr:HU family DNA-binding protein [Planctomycetota bacterium]
MAAKIDVLRKRQLAQALVEKTGSKLKFALAVVDFIFDEIAASVSKGIKVNIKDFGIFVKAQRKARVGRNPATGQPIKIKASVKPRFSASKALKEAVGGKKYSIHADPEALKAITPAGPAVKSAAKKIAPAGKSVAKKASAARKPALKKAPVRKAAKRSK